MSDPNSIVDFLVERNRDASRAARRDLWHQFQPLERYEYTAEQNLRLLEFLRMAETIPQIQLIRGTQIYDASNDLLVRMQGTDTGTLHTGFGGDQAVDVLPYATFSIGNLDGPGLTPVVIQTGANQSEMLVVAVPNDTGQLDVGLWETSYEYDTPPTPIVVDTADDSLLERFFDAITEDAMERAFLTAGDQFLQPDSLFGVGLDLFVGITVSLVFPPAGTGVLVRSAVGVGTTFIFNFLDALVDEVTLSTADKARLKQLLFVGGLVRTGFHVSKLFRAQGMCKKIQGITTGGNLAVKTFELSPVEESTHLAGSLVRNSFAKSISLFCNLKSAESRRREQ